MGQFTTAQETALTEEYLQCDLNPSKAPDFALVIAGWPTVYVCHGEYSIPSGAGGDIDADNGFTTVRKWMQAPSGYTSEVKGLHPELGKFDIGVMECEILDVNAEGFRELSDLISRQAYLEGNSSGTTTSLAGAISSTDTTLTVDDSTGLAEGDVVFISQEAILLGTQATNTFSNCTRGYRLTSAEAHADDVKVYGFMPAVFRRKAWVLKGYQNLTLDQWLKGFGGVIVHESKTPGSVSLGIRATTWEMNAKGSKHLVRFAEMGKSIGIRGGLYEGDYLATLTVDTTKTGAEIATLLGDGHWALNVGDEWLGITSATYVTDTADGARFLDCNVVKALSGGRPTTRIGDATDIGSGTLAWTNCDFTVFENPDPLTSLPLQGSDPITLMLQLLTSVEGDGENGTYDVFVPGTGLGIPEDMIDVASFEAVQDEPDYDDSLRCFFLLKERTEAKKFIEDELCKPFGWFIYTRNDGRIALRRPKNPVKFHVSRGNNIFDVRVPTSTGNIYRATIASGVYTNAELGTALESAVNAVVPAFASKAFVISADYNTSTNKFEVADDGSTALDWDIVETSGSDGWATLGIAAQTVVSTVTAVSTAVGAFTSTSFNTLTENEMMDVQVIDNRDSQVSQVAFRGSYSWHEDDYKSVKIYEDAESRNIYGSAGAVQLEIKSKGLLILRTSTGATAKRRSPWSVFRHPFSGTSTCEVQRVDVSTSYGLDADNSWFSLYAAMLFDRYKHPPTMLRARIPWRFNTKEPGDVLQVTYSIDGTFADRELNETTLTSRLFEIVSAKPAWRDGQVEVVMIGHRSAT